MADPRTDSLDQIGAANLSFVQGESLPASEEKSSNITTIDTKRDKKAFGRPRIAIDWSTFDKLCGLHCTLEEMAGFFSCSERTIEKAVKHAKGMTFFAYFGLKSSVGKLSLRRFQYAAARDGNTGMQIWLGKQWLGQRDESLINDPALLKKRVMIIEDEEPPAKQDADVKAG